MGPEMFSLLPPSRASRALEATLHVSMIKLSIDPQTPLPLQPFQTPRLSRLQKYSVLLQ